jgi:penicillin-binding protein 1A
VAGVWVGFDQPRRIMANGYASQLAAPIWGRFMRGATDGRSAGWIEQPDDVVAVEICGESGLLPGAGCTRVVRADESGEMSWRSVVGVEHFQRGPVPKERCPIHVSTSIVGSIVGQFRAVVDGHPELASATAVPSLSVIGQRDAIAALSKPGSAVDSAAGPDEKAKDEKAEGGKKKRFWSRLFGAFKGGGK